MKISSDPAPCRVLRQLPLIAGLAPDQGVHVARRVGGLSDASVEGRRAGVDGRDQPLHRRCDRLAVWFAVLAEEYNNITYISSDDDYDGFCKMNKQNELRKSLSTFLKNAVKNGFVEPGPVIRILCALTERLLAAQSIADKKNENDELVENIVIL